MIDAVIDAFAHGLGLSDFRWADHAGVAAFAFDRRGTLYLEDRAATLLVYLGRDLDARDRLQARLAQALRLCHYHHHWPFTIQAGLRDDSHLVFLARLPHSEVTLPALEQALDLLTRLHTRIDEAA